MAVESVLREFSIYHAFFYFFFDVCMLFVYTISVRTSAISQETNLPGLSESTS